MGKEEGFLANIEKMQSAGASAEKLEEYAKSVGMALPDSPVGGFLNDAAGKVADAFTGANVPIENSSIPELTEAQIGFFESFIPNIKLGLTVDPVEKAKIIQSHFKGDGRFGGAFTDKHGNPVIEWEGKPYYVNKPGFTRQDAGDLVAQTAQFIGPSKFASGGKSLLKKGARAFPAFGATSLAQQGGTMAADGRDDVSLDQAALMGGIGSAFETGIPVAGRVLRPVAEAVGGAVKGAAGRVASAVTSPFPRFQAGAKAVGSDRAAPPQGLSGYAEDVERVGGEATSQYPLTKGQREMNVKQLEEEDLLRNSAKYGEGASTKIQDFDRAQLGAIESDVRGLQGELGTGAGFEMEALPTIGGKLQDKLSSEAARLKKAGDDAFTAAADSPDPAVFMRGHINKMADNMLGVLKESGITTRNLQQMPNLKSATEWLRRVRRLSAKDRFRPQNYAQINAFRKSLNTDIGSSVRGSPEFRALTKMKNTLDDTVEELVANNVVQGGGVLKLKEANRAWGDYKKFVGETGADVKDASAKLMGKIIDDMQATAEDVAKAFVGISKIDGSAKTRNLVRRVVKHFGQGSEEVRLIKDAFLYRLATQPTKGASDISRTAIIKNNREAMRSSKSVMEELFTPKDMMKIKRIVADVAPTMPAEIRMNPSGSGYTMIGAMRQSGILSTLGDTLNMVPLKSIAGFGKAANAVAPKPRFYSHPVASSVLEGQGSRLR